MTTSVFILSPAYPQVSLLKDRLVQHRMTGGVFAELHGCVLILMIEISPLQWLAPLPVEMTTG